MKRLLILTVCVLACVLASCVGYESPTAHTHTPAEAVRENETPATCEADGRCEEVVYCSECKEELSREEKVLPKGHTPADAAVEENRTEATCTADGSYDTVLYCTVCEQAISRETTVLPKGHKPADATVEENRTEATCTADGSYDTVLYCTVCEEAISRETTVLPKGHTYAYGFCTRCGDVKITKGLGYIMTSNGQSYLAKGMGTCTEGDIVIGGEYQGKPVVGIYKQSYGSTLLTSVVLLDGVTDIGEWAFSGATNLKTVVFPDGVSAIGKWTFNRCSSLESVFLGRGLTSIGSWAFDGCTALTDIYFAGTPEEWAAITVDGNNAPLLAAKVHFNCDIKGENHYHVPGESVKENEIAPSCMQDGRYDAVLYCTSCAEEFSRTTLSIPSTGEHAMEHGVCTGCGGKQSSEGLLFTLNADGKGYTLSGLGTCTAQDIVVDIYENLPVTKIADGALKDAKAMRSIFIGASVKSIGKEAFSGCTSLTELTVPDGVTSFGSGAIKGCSALTTLVIGDGVTSLSNTAFSGCAMLLSVTLGRGITTLGEKLFNECTHLSTLTVHADNAVYMTVDSVLYTKDGATLVRYPMGLTEESFTVPAEVTALSAYAFSDCEYLSVLTLPDGLLHVAASALDGCTALTYTVYENASYLGSATNAHLLFVKVNDKTATALTVHADTRVIAPNAAYECTKLTSLTIPDSVVTVEARAFGKCSSLTELTIGAGVKEIGERAFVSCKKLGTVAFGGAVEHIGLYAFGGCSALGSVTLPDSLLTVGESAFTGCEALSSVTLGASVVSIGDEAFYECTSLLSVTLPASLKTLGSRVFDTCTSLKTVTVNADLTECDTYVFADCTALTKVVFGEGVTTLHSRMFDGCTKLTTVILPTSITTIDSWALDGCTALKTIHYRGTQAQWKQISISSLNDVVKAARIQYGYTGD